MWPFCVWVCVCGGSTFPSSTGRQEPKLYGHRKIDMWDIQQWQWHTNTRLVPAESEPFVSFRWGSQEDMEEVKREEPASVASCFLSFQICRAFIQCWLQNNSCAAKTAQPFLLYFGSVCFYYVQKQKQRIRVYVFLFLSLPLPCVFFLQVAAASPVSTCVQYCWLAQSAFKLANQMPPGGCLSDNVVVMYEQVAFGQVTVQSVNNQV